jgi:hypothetical protein
MQNYKVSLIVMAVILSGCGLESSDGSVSLTRTTDIPQKPGYEVEVVTAKDLAKQEVMAATTAFELDAAKDGEAWSRAQIFIKAYRNEPLADGSAFATKLTSSNPKSEFTYNISKNRVGQVYAYDVTCTSNKQPNSEVAELNAKNLARFITTGTFEQSLWVK